MLASPVSFLAFAVGWFPTVSSIWFVSETDTPLSPRQSSERHPNASVTEKKMEIDVFMKRRF